MAQTAGVALIDIGQLDGAAGHLLHLFCERSDLGSVAWSAAVTFSTSRWPKVSTAIWTFEPLRRLAPS
jgi:hypothetical protein